LSGGAKYTTRLREQGATWILGGTAHLFKDHNEVLCVEWSLQHAWKSRHLKHRAGMNRQNAYLRNLDNLFFIAHEVACYKHIIVAIHSSPQQTLLEIVQKKYKRFAVIPERLLLERSYEEFINNYNASTGQSSNTPNGNKGVLLKRKPAVVVKKHNALAEKYREEARRLSARTRLVIDLRSD
jgi:hypothetical protein